MGVSAQLMLLTDQNGNRRCDFKYFQELGERSLGCQQVRLKPLLSQSKAGTYRFTSSGI